MAQNTTSVPANITTVAQVSNATVPALNVSLASAETTESKAPLDPAKVIRPEQKRPLMVSNEDAKRALDIVLKRAMNEINGVP